MHVPGFILSWITYPGAVSRIAMKHLFCQRAGAVIHKVGYFRIGFEPCQFAYEPPKTLFAAASIEFGPLILNSLLAAILTLPYSIQFLTYGQIKPLQPLALWIGASLAFQSLPDAPYTFVLLEKCLAKPRSIARLIMLPIVSIAYTGAVLRHIFAFFYTLLVIGIPATLLL